MALGYKKRRKVAGSSNTHTTTSHSSHGYSSSVTTKTGNSTVTQSKHGTRVTQNLGGGWFSMNYIPNAHSQWKRKWGKKQKLGNPLYVLGFLILMHWLGIF